MLKPIVLVLIFIIPLLAQLDPLEDDIPAEEDENRPENCLAIVGDSVAFGTLVVMIPEQGFATIRTSPLSVVMEDYLESQSIELSVRDRSVAASSLTSRGKSPYPKTPSYAALLEDRCAFVWILPWVNDLTYGSTLRHAHDYVNALQRLVETLTADNPEGQIIISGYYRTRPDPFTTSYYGNGVRAKNIDRFNAILFAACTRSGRLGAFGQVKCMETESAFKTDGNTHILRRLSRRQLDTALYEPLPAESRPLFNAFWGQRPGGRIRADGVHLSAQGKYDLVQAFFARYLASEFTSTSSDKCLPHRPASDHMRPKSALCAVRADRAVDPRATRQFPANAPR